MNYEWEIRKLDLQLKHMREMQALYQRKTMSIEEQIQQLQHVVAGHIEQAKKDYEENRRFVRESREDWQRQLKESKEEWDRGMAEMRAEMAIRDKVADERIEKLVTAIGQFIKASK